MGPILVPYGSHMDVPRWVPDESLLQNPHQSHMGCPYRTHIISHLGPIWVLYSLLAGHILLSLSKASENILPGHTQFILPRSSNAKYSFDLNLVFSFKTFNRLYNLPVQY